MATHSSVLAWRIPGTGEPGAAVPGVAAKKPCSFLAQGQHIPSNFIRILCVRRKLQGTKLKAGAINVKYAQLNKLFKYMATDSQVCPLG